jgi:hypothetical protein
MSRLIRGVLKQKIHLPEIMVKFGLEWHNPSRTEYLGEKFEKVLKKAKIKGEKVDALAAALSVLDTDDQVVFWNSRNRDQFVQFVVDEKKNCVLDYPCIRINKDMYFTYYQVLYCLESLGLKRVCYAGFFRRIYNYRQGLIYLWEDHRGRFINAYPKDYDNASLIVSKIFSEVFKVDADKMLISFLSNKKFWI